MRKTVGAAGPLREALKSLQPELELALLYGSVSKEAEAADSDRGVLVVSDALTLARLYAAMASAEKALSRKVNVTLYTGKEYRRRLRERSPFLTRTIFQGPVLLMGDEHGLAQSR